MTCDDVFDLLTAPQPVASAVLVQHLHHCRRCRDLVEVLEPLRGPWVDESPLSSGEFDAGGAASGESVELARSAARQLRAPQTAGRITRRRQEHRFLGYVTTFLAGAVAAVCLAASLQYEQAAQPAPGRICLDGQKLLERSGWKLSVEACQTCHNAGAKPADDRWPGVPASGFEIPASAEFESRDAQSRLVAIVGVRESGPRC